MAVSQEYADALHEIHELEERLESEIRKNAQLQIAMGDLQAIAKTHQERFAMRCKRESAQATRIWELECEIRRLKAAGGRPVPLT